jgi:O-antigen/teichoic acid export membrane protein
MDALDPKKIKRQLFGFSFGPIVSAIIGAVTVPLITWFIAPAELGKASMFTMIQQLISLFYTLAWINPLCGNIMEKRKRTFY